MKDNYLKYSILMSVYHKEKPEYLKKSIESMLNQTILCNEFVLVKDGPLTCELEDVINCYVLKYKQLFKIISLEENQGLGLALKIGVESCKNEWIARMDSDDYSIPKRMEIELSKIMEDKSQWVDK